jgi:hypothetical protein
MRRILLTSVLAAATMAALAPPAASDAVYHSAMIPFSAIGNAPLRSGFVENIHANGPIVFAHEQYVVNGAEPNTTYTVVITIFVKDPTCSNAGTFSFPTATLKTNSAGDGTAHHVFTPEDATNAGIRGLLVGGMWQLVANGTPEYATGCAAVQLD